MSDHKEKEYSVFEIAMNLFVACMVSGVILAATYYFTAPIAIEKAEELKKDAMTSLVKDADAFIPVLGKKEWFEAQKDGHTIAFVVPSESKGFGGEIDMLVAVDLNGKIINYDILKHNETPGLGDGANKPVFKTHVSGKDHEHLEVTKDAKETELIQAMTGATISSKAVIKGIREADEAVISYMGGK